MVVVTVGQSKGGVGKTTLAVNLAGELARLGRSVTLIDADPQGSATQWSEPRKLAFPVRPSLLAEAQAPAWIRDVLKIADEFVIVDTPAGLSPTFETAAFIADLVVVPCGPSSLDLSAVARTIASIKAVRRNDPPGVRCRIVTVPTRVDGTTEEGQQIAEELADLGEAVGPALSHDAAFVRCFTSGLTVSALPDAPQAAEEVRRLAAFLLRQVRARPASLP